MPQLLTAPASVSSGALTPVPVPPARLLGLWRSPHAPPPRPLLVAHQPTLRPRLLRARRRPVPVTPRAHGCRHGHGHVHHHHQGHRHGHCHGHRGGADDHGARGAGVGGAAIMRAARAVGLAGVADALREHLHVCCGVLLGLLLVAAACPLVAPLGSASRLVQAALVAVACPLVGVILTVAEWLAKQSLDG